MNSFLTLTLAAALCALTAAATVESWEMNAIVQEDIATNVTRLTELRALRQNVRDRGCDINLCFAIDGSGSVTPAQFQKQKDFVDLIINILTTDEPGNFCAVQYGTSLRSISPLTRRKNRFVRKLDRSRQVGGLSNIAGALGYTGFQLRPRKEDANKLIVLGDGFNSIGFEPRKVARQVLEEGISICAVAVGESDVEGLNAITGDPGRVVRLNDFFDLGEIVVDVVNDACGFYADEYVPTPEPVV